MVSNENIFYQEKHPLRGVLTRGQVVKDFSSQSNKHRYQLGPSLRCLRRDRTATEHPGYLSCVRLRIGEKIRNRLPDLISSVWTVGIRN